MLQANLVFAAQACDFHNFQDYIIVHANQINNYHSKEQLTVYTSTDLRAQLLSPPSPQYHTQTEIPKSSSAYKLITKTADPKYTGHHTKP
jgi:hypothetical protein